MARVLGARYELRERLAVGGMAEVYVAHDQRLGRDVAIKILRTDLPDARARERFEHEARLSAGLDHPNAVTVYDVGEDGARPYLVMELIDGEDLARRLAERGPRSAPEAVHVLDGVLRALEAAHARGIVHRDVKPGNVLLGRDGRVRLADFGIAKAVAAATADLTMAGQVIGTPRYLAPEQRRGEPATPRSDVYAAGVVLYEMLSGAAPAVDDTMLAAGSAGDVVAPPPLATRRPDVPAALAAVADRALAFDPADRFADAAAMRAALAAAGRAGVVAAPVSSPSVPGPATVLLPATALQPAKAPATPPPVGATSGRSGDQAAGAARGGKRGSFPALAVFGGLAVLSGAVVLAVSLLGADEGGAVTTTTAAAPITSATTIAPATTRPATTTPATTRPATTTPAPATTRATTTTVAATTTTRPATTTTRAATTTTRPATTTTVVAPPTSIDDLVAVLSQSTAGYGRRAATLLADLREIQTIDAKRRGGRDLRNAAAAELDAIDGWLREGSLDPTMAAWAQGVLRPLAG